MATSNISPVSTANTFDQWRITTNDLVGVANTLLNGNFSKDSGGFSVQSITATQATISGTGTVTDLNVTGTLNYLGNDLIELNASAANTAKVSANGGSTLSKQFINFVNTASVIVAVGSGAGTYSGNANISFSVSSDYVTQSELDSAIAGVQASTGTQGAQGVQGRQGTQGTQGSTGSQGSTGTQGTQGTQGSIGTQGTQGSTGSQGSTGTQGAQGTQGSTGITGTQYLNMVTSGYTTSAKVFVQTSQPTATGPGDIWLQI